MRAPIPFPSKPRDVSDEWPDVHAHQLRGAAFIELLRQAIEAAETSAECRALWRVLAESEEQIGLLTTACMAKHTKLQMRGK